MIIKNVARKLLRIKDILNTSIKEIFLTLFGKDDVKYLEANMLVVAHSLEKGLSMKNIKVGFGQKKATNLCYYIEEYNKKSPGNTDYPLIESIGILTSYLHYQNQQNHDIGILDERIRNIINGMSDKQKQTLSQYSYGTKIIEASFFEKGKSFNLEEFVSTRRSVRAYNDKPIQISDLYKAINIANYSPSACNRQPSSVYVALGGDMAVKIRGLLKGNQSFTNFVENFAVVTCDRSSFFGNEQFQWYINGGIYLANFVLSLHSLGIGSCIMQWFAFNENENKLKKLMNIRHSEAIIAVVSMGYYPDNAKCLCAQRKPVEETLKILS